MNEKQRKELDAILADVYKTPPLFTEMAARAAVAGNTEAAEIYARLRAIDPNIPDLPENRK